MFARPRRRSDDPAAALYLELLKLVLTRITFREEGSIDPESRERGPLKHELRYDGRDWPLFGETMIGVRRLDQLQEAVETVLAERVPGDLIETGVWRGGACILMRAVLAAHGDTSRTVWLADSFQGLPPSDGDNYPADAAIDLSGVAELAVPLEGVRDNFRRYGLLDEQVRFLEGWFRDTLPDAPVERLAVLRLDGDLYESTKIALDSLYPKLSLGGFTVIDDYGAAPMCRQAVDEYRRDHAIEEQIHEIDWTGVYWRRR